MLYWVMVLLSLFVSGGVHLFGGNPAWVGSLGGALLGFGGAAFGTWADAQRYLLRLQLSGGQPPA
jgi:hypothetical protein